MKEPMHVILSKETREWLETIFKAQKSAISLRWKLTAFIVATATVISAFFQVLSYCCH